MTDYDNEMEVAPLVGAPEAQPTEHGAVPNLGNIAIGAGDATAIHNPNALASPEATAEAHTKLNALIDRVLRIDNVPSKYIWDSTPSRGAGDSSVTISSLRLMSLPSHTDKNGRQMGESFVWISYFNGEDGKRNIMVTEDKGSGNPFGDVLGSIEAGAIVKRITRTDTAFLEPDSAETRNGSFTFGPAQLEKEQNAAQANNPFEAATAGQIDRINEIMKAGSIYAHNGQMELPKNPEDLQTVAIADLIS